MVASRVFVLLTMISFKCHLHVSTGKPTVVASQSSAGATGITFSCEATSTTQPTDSNLGFLYTWNYDGTDVDSVSNSDRFTHDGNTMTVNDIELADAGKQVTCTATEDVAGGISSDTSIAVTVSLPGEYSSQNILHNRYKLVSGCNLYKNTSTGRSIHSSNQSPEQYTSQEN